TDGATVVDLDYEKEYTWYAADGSWRDRGQTTLTLATSAAAGMVRGTDGTSGKVLVEMDGTMSLVGYDALVAAQEDAASGISDLDGRLAPLTQDIDVIRKVSSLPSDASSNPRTLYLVTG
ncbi:MAG: hypothetical protein LBQ15_03880, partial [Clostridium sp.]|nr:hypothetical protein [Clostridium sp.]